MKCKTTNRYEIEKFVQGAIKYALREQHQYDPAYSDGGPCWCNHCRSGGGRLTIGGVDSQDFCDEKNLWGEQLPHQMNHMGLGTLTQNASTPIPTAAEIIHAAITANGVTYVTGSGAGRYTFKNGVLSFDGFRNSFYGGNECFTASRDGEWKLVESTKPEWGVWDRK